MRRWALKSSKFCDSVLGLCQYLSRSELTFEFSAIVHPRSDVAWRVSSSRPKKYNVISDCEHFGRRQISGTIFDCCFFQKVEFYEYFLGSLVNLFFWCDKSKSHGASTSSQKNEYWPLNLGMSSWLVSNVGPCLYSYRKQVCISCVEFIKLCEIKGLFNI